LCNVVYYINYKESTVHKKNFQIKKATVALVVSFLYNLVFLFGKRFKADVSVALWGIIQLQ